MPRTAEGAMSVVGTLHQRGVFERRVRVLANTLALLVPERVTVLDVGCGDGSLDEALAALRPDLRIQGIDVLARPAARIPVTPYDGETIPFADKSFDVVQFVDVLHHTLDPHALLREARRVARRAIVLKDHGCDGILAGPTLRFMDWAGNAHHGVALPYNYWPARRWREAFDELDLFVEAWEGRLGLYPFPFSLVFERALHFATRLGLSRP
jgi:SAM-dependent methyltransferase